MNNVDWLKWSERQVDFSNRDTRTLPQRRRVEDSSEEPVAPSCEATNYSTTSLSSSGNVGGRHRRLTESSPVIHPLTAASLLFLDNFVVLIVTEGNTLPTARVSHRWFPSSFVTIS